MSVHWAEIDRLVRAHLKVDPTASEEDLRRQLEMWWCIKYDRPFKDPLLPTYSLNELVYEYLTFLYLNAEHDPRSDEQMQKSLKEDEDWVKKQLAEMRNSNQKTKQNPSTTQEPNMIDPKTLPELSTQFDQ